MVEYFSKKFASNYNLKKLNIDVNNKYLLNYDWPGNIRELRNLIDRIAILCPDNAEKTSNIIKESTLLTNKAHQALLEAFEDQEISKVAKATIGIRYLTLVGAQSTAYEKSNSKYIELSKRTDNNEEVAKWFVDVLEGIRDLKPSRGERTDDELRNRVYELIELSNNMPKNR